MLNMLCALMLLFGLDLPIEAMRGMSFAQKVAAFAGLGSFGARGGRVPDDRAPDTSGAVITQAVKRLGLELQARKAPVETIIVDHAEKTPIAN
jgi:uncharacterized protein (TIGR03435 family)